MKNQSKKKSQKSIPVHAKKQFLKTLLEIY